jgi:hypothetical protein
VSNSLNKEKKQQVLALGRLGWSLRRIQCATQIRRETTAGYLRAAGIPVRPPGEREDGFDLVATPFRQVKVGYAIGSAWVD